MSPWAPMATSDVSQLWYGTLNSFLATVDTSSPHSLLTATYWPQMVLQLPTTAPGPLRNPQPPETSQASQALAANMQGGMLPLWNKLMAQMFSYVNFFPMSILNCYTKFAHIRNRFWNLIETMLEGLATPSRCLPRGGLPGRLTRKWLKVE